MFNYLIDVILYSNMHFIDYQYILELVPEDDRHLYEHDFIPTGVHHIAVRWGIWNQVHTIFVKKDIVQQIHNYKKRYKGF